MKRLFAALAVAVLLATGSVFAQPSGGRENATPGGYQVVEGDNLWNLAGAKLNDPFLWKQILEANPFLKTPGRVIEKDGKTIVIVHKGEVLNRLEALGIIPKPITLAELQVATPTPVTIIVEKTPTSIKALLGLFVILLLLAAVGLAVLRYILNQDPARSGRPFVRGGVNDDSTAANQFRNMASRQFGLSAGTFTVIQQTPGRIYGVMNVRYADGTERPRQLNGDRAYRAQVRFQDGRVEELYMLQACGNDLRYGGISRYIPGAGFRFVPEEAAASAQVSTTVSTAVTSPVEEPIVEEPTADDSVTTPETALTTNGNGFGEIKIEFRTAKAERRNGQRGQQKGDDNDMVRISGVEVESFTFIKDGEETTFRYRPVRASKQSTRASK